MNILSPRGRAANSPLTGAGQNAAARHPLPYAQDNEGRAHEGSVCRGDRADGYSSCRLSSIGITWHLGHGIPNGESFVADVHASRRSPDCIVIDLLVSDADDTAIFETLRRVHPIPTIVLGGDPGVVPLELIDEGQLHAVLKKPVSPEVFIKTIEDNA